MTDPEPTPAGQLTIDDIDDEVRHCRFCGAVCDIRVQACECGADCPLPPVAR